MNPWRNQCRAIFLMLLLCFTTGLVHAQATYTYFTFDYPGATATYANGINNEGDIVGNYVDSSNVIHGFSYFRGNFTAINVPNATFTDARGINNKGVIVGDFGASSTTTEGFLLRNKSYTKFSVSGATFTDLTGINDFDIAVGTYVNSSGASNGLRLSPNGQYDTLDYPGSTSTAANAINDAGAVTGQTSPPFISAFLYSGGHWTDFYYPGAQTSTGDGINNSTQIVGIWSPRNPSLPQEGFLRNSDGTFQDISYPGSSGSAAMGINDGGDIVGYYTDSAGLTHGFVAMPVKK
jgi:hypothetical protein